MQAPLSLHYSRKHYEKCFICLPAPPAAPQLP